MIRTSLDEHIAASMQTRILQIGPGLETRQDETRGVDERGWLWFWFCSNGGGGRATCSLILDHLPNARLTAFHVCYLFGSGILLSTAGQLHRRAHPAISALYVP